MVTISQKALSVIPWVMMSDKTEQGGRAWRLNKLKKKKWNKHKKAMMSVRVKGVIVTDKKTPKVLTTPSEQWCYHNDSPIWFGCWTVCEEESVCLDGCRRARGVGLGRR